jgi:3-oxoacyl-[acyl-carrier protein] reductase
LKKNAEYYYRVDVSDSNKVQEMIARMSSSLERIILLNCAGISYHSIAHKAGMELRGRVIDVNMKGSFNLICALLPYMRDQGYERIINVSSVVAALPTLCTSAYDVSKAGLLGLQKALAAENARRE